MRAKPYKQFPPAELHHPAGGVSGETRRRVGTTHAVTLLTLAFIIVARASLGAIPPTVQPLGWISSNMVAPSSLALDSAGSLYVADPQGRQVAIVDSTGRVVVKTNFGVPISIAIGPDRNVYIGDRTNRSVAIYDPQLKLLSQLGQGAGEFLLPNSLCFGVTSDYTNVYVCDSGVHQVKLYRGGTLFGTIGSFGSSSAHFNFPAGVYVSKQLELYVLDQNNDRVQVFDLDGLYRRSFALKTPEQRGRSGRSQGICGDALGRIYVSDTFQGLLRVFDESGVFLSPIGSYGRGAGQLNLPTAVLADNLGHLFVAASGNSRVELFGLDTFSLVSGVVLVDAPDEDPGKTTLQPAQSAPPPAPPALSGFVRPDGDMVLTWDDSTFMLQSASEPRGPWQPVLGGESPYIVPESVIAGTPAQFFRLKSP
ncbi:MAG TPA: NHL repeat-containing protein [Candidatus Dormibacteraeota bacterium]|nr:NHL repeat-containing protein [Candidatus Dormibacteraeota bacterium]